MDCLDIIFTTIMAFLCMPSVLGNLFKMGTKTQNALIHAVLFSLLFSFYMYSMNRKMEGFTKNGESDAFYKNAYHKCMRKNSPPFMGSISDTINYCLNNISSRFVK